MIDGITISLILMSLCFIGLTQLALLSRQRTISRRLDRLESWTLTIKVKVAPEDDPDDDRPNEFTPAPEPENVVAFGRAA